MTTNPDVPYLDAEGRLATPSVLAQLDARTDARMRDQLPVLADELGIGGYGVEILVGGAPPQDGWWLDTGGVTSVTATAPTFTDQDGTASDAYTIPSKTGVEYLVGGVVKAAGTYPASGTVTVTARATPGYVLSGTTTWSATFSTAAAPVSVTATAPTADDAANTYTIPAKTGVEYLVGGAVQSAGVKSVGDVDATVTVTARATSGYVLSGPSSWTLTFTKTPPVPIPSGAYDDAVLADGPALYLPLDDAAGTTSPRVLGAYAAFNTFGVVGTPTFGAGGIGDGATSLSKTSAQSGVLSVENSVMKSATAGAYSNGAPISMEIIASDMATLAPGAGTAPIFGFTQAKIDTKQDGTILGPGGLATPASAGGALAARKHIAYTFDGTTARLYINGTEAASSTTAKPGFSGANKFGLDTGNGWAATGRYAGMVFYDKALAPDRVLAHAKAAGLA